MIIRAINKKTYVDEIFKGHYNIIKEKYSLVDRFLVKAKDPRTGKMKYVIKGEEDSELSYELRRHRAAFMFKNKLSKMYKEDLY